MIQIDKDDLAKVAQYMKEYLINVEYEQVHLSYQLAQTSMVSFADDSATLSIPAPTYDIGKYKEKGVVIHDNKGSYASANDTEGGFSGKHEGYLQRAIEHAIQRLLTEKNIDISEVEIRWN